MDKELNCIPGISEKISSLKSNIKKHIKGKDEVMDNCLCLAIVEKTKDSERFELGVSPRGAIILKRLAMARAVLEDRTYCIPDDIKKMVVPAFSHRIVLREAAPSGVGKERVELTNLLREVTVPV